MSAAAALDAARNAGISIDVDGDDLVLQAYAPPPAVVLDLLSRHKAAVVTLLRTGVDGWSAEDWQVFFDERAAIAEFDGGLSREEAEREAMKLLPAEINDGSITGASWYRMRRRRLPTRAHGVYVLSGARQR